MLTATNEAKRFSWRIKNIGESSYQRARRGPRSPATKETLTLRVYPAAVNDETNFNDVENEKKEDDLEYSDGAEVSIDPFVTHSHVIVMVFDETRKIRLQCW